jgi:hypothetical protein
MFISQLAFLRVSVGDVRGRPLTTPISIASIATCLAGGVDVPRNMRLSPNTKASGDVMAVEHQRPASNDRVPSQLPHAFDVGRGE